VRRRVAAALLAVVGFVAAVPLAIGGPARAADEPEPIVVTIDTLAPIAPGPTDTLTLAGTVSNPSPETVPAVTVRLRIGIAALDGRVALAGDLSAAETTSVDDSRTPVLGSLLPGQSAPFRLSVPMEALDLSAQGVYVLVAEAQSDPGDGNLERVGSGRTLLPWFPDPTTTPAAGLVTLWPLTETPAVGSDGVLLTDSLPRAIAPGGRLRVLLEAGATRPDAITWLVDPALVETVDSMGGGYRLLRDGQVVAGARPDASTDWLDELRRVTGRADVFALPYGYPDSVALVRGGLGRDVTRSITTAAGSVGTVLRRPITSTLAWPPGGRTDPATLRVIADSAPRGILLSAAQLTADSPFTPSGTAVLPGGATSATAVVPDPVLSLTLGARPSSDGERLLARQRLLAELAMIAMELPDSPRTVVMAPSPVWASTSSYLTDVLGAITSVPWVRPTSLSALLGAEPSSITRTLAPYPDRVALKELPAAYVARISQAQSQAALSSEVVPSSARDTTAVYPALLRSGSALFRQQQPVGTQIVDGALVRATAPLTGIRIVSKGAITLPGDTGLIPLSIANDLDTAVTVGISLTATPSVLLSTVPVPPVTIPARSTTLVEVSARVSGSAPVPLTARLTSASGTPFGEPASLQVGTTAYSRAASWVVGVAFALLVLTIVLSAIRRFRGRRSHQGGGGSAPHSDAGATMEP